MHLSIDGRARNRIDREVMASLAGVLAAEEAGFDGAGGDDDFAAAAGFATYVSGSAQEASAFLEWMRLRRRSLLRSDYVWRGVEVLAPALSDRGTLRWPEARDIIEGAALHESRSE